MAIIKQGGSNPNSGKVTTTMGIREPRAPICEVCGERKTGQLYTINANGQKTCADCSGRVGEGVLKGVCDPENCACGQPNED